MSLDTLESSRSLGEPQTLYRFTYQDRAFCYTDAEQAITADAGGGDELYSPIPIDRDAVTSSGTLDRAALKIRLPKNADVAELFRVFPPSEIVGVTIYQGHVEDPDDEFLAIWSGRVISGSRAGAIATLTCEPVSTSMRRVGLRRRYQYSCPHALYGDRCKVIRALYTVEAEVQSVAGITLTFAAGWHGALAPTRFLDGLVEWTNGEGSTELRAILKVEPADNRITIAGRRDTLNPGDTVSLSLGCNHLEDGCNVFGNIQNFGGQPWIPKRNPVGFVNQFY